MATSAFPAAINNLFRIVRVQFNVTQPLVDVLDGPSTEDIGQDIVGIGIAADDASMDSDLTTAGLYTDLETFDVVNMVRSWNGDNDLQGRRARAFELFQEVATIIKSNPTLDGAVTRARINSVSYTPARLPEGAVATVTFRVRIEAFTS